MKKYFRLPKRMIANKYFIFYGLIVISMCLTSCSSFGSYKIPMTREVILKSDKGMLWEVDLPVIESGVEVSKSINSIRTAGIKDSFIVLKSLASNVDYTVYNMRSKSVEFVDEADFSYRAKSLGIESVNLWDLEYVIAAYKEKNQWPGDWRINEK